MDLFDLATMAGAKDEFQIFSNFCMATYTLVNRLEFHPKYTENYIYLCFMDNVRDDLNIYLPYDIVALLNLD